jgi:hypothetical protein
MVTLRIWFMAAQKVASLIYGGATLGRRRLFSIAARLILSGPRSWHLVNGRHIPHIPAA